jgi:hypothetical protein
MEFLPDRVIGTSSVPCTQTITNWPGMAASKLVPKKKVRTLGDSSIISVIFE